MTSLLPILCNTNEVLMLWEERSALVLHHGENCTVDLRCKVLLFKYPKKYFQWPTNNKHCLRVQSTVISSIIDNDSSQDYHSKEEVIHLFNAFAHSNHGAKGRRARNIMSFRHCPIKL